ncbi:ADP-ribosyltransferase [Pseudoxanthomonas sp. UTMC 1351]|uniref:ADP-ribosyltransferase n=1 Tax=Pseudoxanthomonas sp. UTMC 1351 TaxID=2695853 RepID=UPI0034CF24E4
MLITASPASPAAASTAASFAASGSAFRADFQGATNAPDPGRTRASAAVHNIFASIGSAFQAAFAAVRNVFANSVSPQEATATHRSETRPSGEHATKVEFDAARNYKCHGKVKEHFAAAMAFERTAPEAQVLVGVDKKLQQLYQKQGVTAQERSAVDSYVLGAAHEVNNALEAHRNEGQPLERSIARNVAKLETFIDKVAMPQKMPVFRVARSELPLAEVYSRISPGDVATGRGFLSTTSSLGLVKDLMGAPTADNPQIYYQIDGLKSGADLAGIYADQHEILVQRGTRFVVDSVSFISGGNALFIRLHEKKEASDLAAPVRDMVSWDKLSLPAPAAD